MSAAPEPAAVPTATVHKRRFPSPVWLVPLGAFALVAYLAVQALARHGPTITVTLSSGEALAPRQTELRYRGVAVGTVDDVRLSSDASSVTVRVRVNGEAERLLTDHASFWVVRPQGRQNLVDALSGLATVVSGAYMEMDPGPPGGKHVTQFRGLDGPPRLRSDDQGRVFALNADRLRGVSYDSPVYFRDTNVGRVLDITVKDGKSPGVVRVFVQAPYDRQVRPSTRFWKEGGVAISNGAAGMRLELESFEAALLGAIAFDGPRDDADAPESPAEAVFTLYEDEAKARAHFPGPKVHCATYVDGSVQGVTAGTPVQIMGLRVGAVTEVRPVPGAEGKGWSARLAFDVDPMASTGDEPDDAKLLAELAAPALADGRVRATVESSSLLTGEKALSLDFVRDGRAPPVAREGDVMVVPGDAADLQGMVSSLGRVAAKLQRLPIDDIGQNLDQAMRSVDSLVSGPQIPVAVRSLTDALAGAQRLVADLDRGLGPALQRLPSIAQQLDQAAQSANATLAAYGRDSAFERSTQRLMAQVTEAARSVRLLAQFLDRHPEAVIEGRTNMQGGR